MQVATGSAALNADQIEEFRAYLDRLLGLPAFASSRRRGQLLRYLIERKLAGQDEQVTEYGIGLDVFDKPPSFDPRIEATVRVEMSRLRRALLDHYENAGASDPWRVYLPSRGYVPTVQPIPSKPAGAFEPPQPETRPLAPGRGRSRLLLAAAGFTAFALGGVLAVRYTWPTRLPIRSVVVLPFENLTGEPRNDYLADGVTEQLTDSLAQVPSLRVVARTSALLFKGKAADIREIGRRLDADTVVEGSLRYGNGILRLTVQVNRSTDGYHILSRSFDGRMQELGQMEIEMVPPILAALRPGATLAKHKTPDPEAHDLFLKARALRGDGTKASFDQAIVYLNQAIERDPSYADAYAGLASVYASGAASHTSEPLEYARRARMAASKALERDPSSAPAYASEGLVDSMVLLEWKRGEQELRIRPSIRCAATLASRSC